MPFILRPPYGQFYGKSLFETGYLFGGKVTRALIKAGADLNTQDEDGATPLHWMAQEGETETARALIKAGADFNIKDGAGNTPLHTAARNLKAPMIRLLTEQGADISAENNKLERPLDVATANGGRTALPADTMAMLEKRPFLSSAVGIVLPLIALGIVGIVGTFVSNLAWKAYMERHRSRHRPKSPPVAHPDRPDTTQVLPPKHGRPPTIDRAMQQRMVKRTMEQGMTEAEARKRVASLAKRKATAHHRSTRS